MLLNTMSFLSVFMFSMCLFSSASSSSSTAAEDQSTECERTFFTKCIPDLGCFETGPPFFNLIHRPISLLPQDPEYINTQFLLFGPGNPMNSTLLKPNLNSLQESTFDPTLETKVIIPGYTSRYEEGDWTYRMKDELLQYSEYNVIMVNWTDGNGPPYPQAVANGRVVGAQLAQLINFIQNNTGIDPKTVHIIGHSLGAHIGGWAGERVDKLGRISGLDPAGPYFQHAEEKVRLDTNDAHFVDVIHTNGGDNMINGLGILEPIGHKDFYPNGGKQQPNCSIVSESDGTLRGNISKFIETRRANSCSHGRVTELYLWSILDHGCTFLAVACDSWESFESGNCKAKCSRDKEQCSVMGFHTKQINGEQKKKFYLRTTATPPYCTRKSKKRV